MHAHLIIYVAFALDCALINITMTTRKNLFNSKDMSAFSSNSESELERDEDCKIPEELEDEHKKVEDLETETTNTINTETEERTPAPRKALFQLNKDANNDNIIEDTSNKESKDNKNDNQDFNDEEYVLHKGNNIMPIPADNLTHNACVKSSLRK